MIYLSNFKMGYHMFKCIKKNYILHDQNENVANGHKLM